LNMCLDLIFGLTIHETIKKLDVHLVRD
jgi:hypothetical protein